MHQKFKKTKKKKNSVTRRGESQRWEKEVGTLPSCFSLAASGTTKTMTTTDRPLADFLSSFILRCSCRSIDARLHTLNGKSNNFIIAFTSVADAATVYPDS